MFIVLYRWRIKPQLEKQFIESWSEITDYFRTNYNSLGSRLHRGNDGLFYGYAQWKNSEQRENAFANENSEISEAGLKMREAIEESFPEIVLEKIADYLA
ncbi:MAG: antibiotic biosynthesis monooxygenase family protein [Pyrinomonadaceae bacterium]